MPSPRRPARAPSRLPPTLAESGLATEGTAARREQATPAPSVQEQVREDCYLLAAWIEDARQDQILRSFAEGLAHRLNNLLTVIVGNASVARQMLPSESPVNDALREIEIAAERGAGITRQTLLYAQKCQLQLKPLNLSRLIKRLKPGLQTGVTSRVRVEYDLNPELPPVLGDRKQLRRLVQNLFLNASEAIGDRPGTILLRTQAIHANRGFLDTTVPQAKLPEGWYIWLQVSDTGCGMDDGTLRRVFEPYFSTKVLGRGLGLSAALGIVRQHRGAIWGASRPGAGTIFQVLLPCLSTVEEVNDECDS